jgi:hypothetical protein
VATCIGSLTSPGPCAGLAPADVIRLVRADAAAAATTTNGFLGDLTRPVNGRTYGPLVADAGY